ncbi:hypothetical protein EQ831_18210 [Pseudomonas sp. ALS1279]|nr:hypothetical protein EQ831_18210 [Pseudomonas sp. ALS1279]
MIVLDRCFCDLCGTFLGQLWNQPACAPDVLPAPDFRVCDDCHSASICHCGQLPGCWFAERGQCLPPEAA